MVCWRYFNHWAYDAAEILAPQNRAWFILALGRLALLSGENLLEQLISSIKTIGKAEDLPLLIPGFAEDGMSDLLTNIFHECLNEFTMAQMHKYDIQSNGTKMFYTWDMHAGEWKKVEKPVYFVNGKELLLVPKNIVRKNYLFRVSQYFTRIILKKND